jgi:transposase-like protein
MVSVSSKQTGLNIRAEIVRNGETITSTASAIGLTAGALSHKLRGTRTLKLGEVQAISEFLGLSLDRLLGDPGQKNGTESSGLVEPVVVPSGVGLRSIDELPDGYSIGADGKPRAETEGVIEKRRIAVLEGFAAGKPGAQLARELGVTKDTIYWDRDFWIKHGFAKQPTVESASEPDEVIVLRREAEPQRLLTQGSFRFAPQRELVGAAA